MTTQNSANGVTFTINAEGNSVQFVHDLDNSLESATKRLTQLHDALKKTFNPKDTAPMQLEAMIHQLRGLQTEINKGQRATQDMFRTALGSSPEAYIAKMQQIANNAKLQASQVAKQSVKAAGASGQQLDIEKLNGNQLRAYKAGLNDRLGAVAEADKKITQQMLNEISRMEHQRREVAKQHKADMAQYEAQAREKQQKSKVIYSAFKPIAEGRNDTLPALREQLMLQKQLASAEFAKSNQSAAYLNILNKIAATEAKIADLSLPKLRPNRTLDQRKIDQYASINAVNASDLYKPPTKGAVTIAELSRRENELNLAIKGVQQRGQNVRSRTPDDELRQRNVILELEAVALVDAVGSTDRQVILRIHPVIKQVDCCPRRRNRRNHVVRKRNRMVRNLRLRAGRQEETRRQRDGEGQNNRIWRDRAQPATTATRHDGPPLARPVFTRKFPA